MFEIALYLGIALILLSFWAVGAYGRLARLRSAVAQALEPLEQLWQQQLELVQEVLSAAPDEVADGGPQRRLTAAAQQFAFSVRRLHERPTRGRFVEMLELTRATLHHAWTQELGATEVQAPTDDAEILSELAPELNLQQQWQVLGHQEQPPLAAFNAAMRAHDRAVSQFPAMLLARLFGFRRGRQLARHPWSPR